MLVDKLIIYKLLDLQQPVIPTRSHLYNLKPIGIGTPYVESLTGYVARLAEAHCIPAGILILSKIVPQIREEYVFDSKDRSIGKIYDSSRTNALNGTGLMATSMVQSLEVLTGRADLRFLTLLTWGKVISQTGLLRPVRAWCPSCYEEWRVSEQVIYEPLIWSINVVRVCPSHHRPLSIQCPHCYQYLPLLAWKSRPGYCSSCREWLGKASDALTADNEVLKKEDEWKWHSYVVDNVGDLIAAAPSFSSPLPRDRIRQAVSEYVIKGHQGNCSAFARSVGMNQAAIHNLYKGKTVPQLNTLWQICYCLETSLLDFLTEEAVPIPSQPKATQHQLGQQRHKTNSPRQPFNLDQARQALLSVLRDDEYPPPSMQAVAKRIGINFRLLYINLPDLCYAISAQYRSYRRARSVEYTEQLRQDVRQAAIELHARGIKPHGAYVGKLLTKPGAMRNKVAIAALREVRQELGYEK